MNGPHINKRGRHFDDQIAQELLRAMSWADEAGLNAVLGQSLRSTNVRADLARVATTIIQKEGGLPLATDFHEDAVAMWPSVATIDFDSGADTSYTHDL